jgi:transcriptional regulator NrdR family protein
MKTMCEICGKNVSELKNERFIGVYRRRACDECFDKYSAFLTSSSSKEISGETSRTIINKFHNIGVLQTHDDDEEQRI